MKFRSFSFVLCVLFVPEGLFAATDQDAPGPPVAKKIEPVAPEWYDRSPSFVIGGGVFTAVETCSYIANHSSLLMNHYESVNSNSGAAKGSFTPGQLTELKAFSEANTECDQAVDRLGWLEPTMNITYWGTWISAIAFIPGVLLWMAEIPEPGVVTAGLLTVTLLAQIILGPWQDSVYERVKKAAELHNRTLKVPANSGQARLEPRRIFNLSVSYRF